MFYKGCSSDAVVRLQKQQQLKTRFMILWLPWRRQRWSILWTLHALNTTAAQSQTDRKSGVSVWSLNAAKLECIQWNCRACKWLRGRREGEVTGFVCVNGFISWLFHWVTDNGKACHCASCHRGRPTVCQGGNSPHKRGIQLKMSPNNKQVLRK